MVLDFDERIASEGFLTNTNGVFGVKKVVCDSNELMQKLVDIGEASWKCVRAEGKKYFKYIWCLGS